MEASRRSGGDYEFERGLPIQRPSIACPLDAPEPVEAFRAALKRKGVLRTVERLFIAYGGKPSIAAPGVPPALVGQWLRDCETALQQDVLRRIGEEADAYRAVVDAVAPRLEESLMQVSSSWASRRPHQQIETRRAKFRRTHAAWVALLDELSSGVARGCAELLELQLQLTSFVALCHEAGLLDLSIRVPAAAIWKDLPRLQLLLRGVASAASDGRDAGRVAEGWLELQAASGDYGGEAMAKAMNLLASEIERLKGRREDSFAAFLTLVLDVAKVLRTVPEGEAELVRWEEMLEGASGGASWWAELLGSAILIPDDMQQLVERCSQAQKSMKEAPFRTRLEASLPDPAARDAFLGNGALLRLGAVALVIHRGSADVKAWLSTAAGRKSSELFRARDGKGTPLRWTLLQDSMHALDDARVLARAVKDLRALDARTQGLVHFCLASKTFSFVSGGVLAYPPEVQIEEPKFSSRHKWRKYIADVQTRAERIAYRLGTAESTAWSGLWSSEAFPRLDVPVLRVDLSDRRKAAEPGDLGYWGGYTFRNVVMRVAQDAGAPGFVVPLFTVPLTRAWPDWFADAPRPSELFWRMRWLSRIDGWFASNVFGPLASPRPPALSHLN